SIRAEKRLELVNIEVKLTLASQFAGGDVELCLRLELFLIEVDVKLRELERRRVPVAVAGNSSQLKFGRFDVDDLASPTQLIRLQHRPPGPARIRLARLAGSWLNQMKCQLELFGFA